MCPPPGRAKVAQTPGRARVNTTVWLFTYTVSEELASPISANIHKMTFCKKLHFAQLASWVLVGVK